MTELWDLLVGPFVEFGFMRRALAGCLALSLGAAPVGVFLLLRRMSLTGDAMAHAILPGAAISYMIAGLSLPAMTAGGIISGLLVAMASTLVARSGRQSEDSSLAAFYLMSLSLGVVIVSTYGNQVDLLHVLFGSVLALDDDTLLLIGVISSITLLGLAVLYRPLVLECVDANLLPRRRSWGSIAHFGFMGLLVYNLVAGGWCCRRPRPAAGRAPSMPCWCCRRCWRWWPAWQVCCCRITSNGPPVPPSC